MVAKVPYFMMEETDIIEMRKSARKYMEKIYGR